MNRQNGAALITALIFLVVLTLVAVTSVQNVTLQEQMSSAVRQGNVALEVAEVALREAEEKVLSLPNPGAFFDSGNGYYDRNAAPDPWSVDWSKSSSSIALASPISINGVDYQPMFFVEYIGPMSSQLETGEIVTGGALNSIGQNIGYRVVARGIGNDGVTERIVEAYVARTYQ